LVAKGSCARTFLAVLIVGSGPARSGSRARRLVLVARDALHVVVVIVYDRGGHVDVLHHLVLHAELLALEVRLERFVLLLVDACERVLGPALRDDLEVERARGGRAHPAP
jgi:hypothetical protein